MSNVQKQLQLVMAVWAYVVFCRISKMFISAIIGYFRLWLGVTVLMLRHLHKQYCPIKSYSYTMSPPVLYSCFQHATQPLLRGVQTRETSVYRAGFYTRQQLCGTDPVSARCVYMYTIVY